MKLEKYIDHTLLKPDATRDQIIQVCQEAKEYGFASVCVNEYYTARGAMSRCVPSSAFHWEHQQRR